MYITIAGIKRSGSTWQANLVRIILEEMGLSVWMGEHYSLDLKEGYDITINKIHPYNEQIAKRSDFVFTSYRPLTQIRSSWYRFTKEQLTPTLQENWIVWLLLWQMHSNYLMPYKAIKEAPEFVVRDLRGIMGLGQTTVEQARKILKRMEEEVVPPTDKQYDPKTCLFSNHITGKKNA